MKNDEGLMVMPPIYRFNLEGYPKESKWGWHKATDVVTTVNNILILQGFRPMTPEEMTEAFPSVMLNTQREYSSFQISRTHSPVIESDRCYGESLVGDQNWLKTVVEGDCFIPAKIGMQFIEAVKHPVKSGLIGLIRTLARF
jgi:hypothetical protein